MMPPRLVIFDCDGVLVDTERPTNEVLRDDLAGRGLDLTVDACVRLFVGGTMASVGVRAAELGAAIPDNWTDLIYAKIYARLRQGISAVPGVVEVLNRLDAAAIPYCVGSNGAPEKMDITLGQTGLLARFDGRLFSPHVIGMEKAKPAPGLYVHAAAEMGVAPADAVVVEDSASGARGAAAAGIPCFGYTRDTPADVLVAEGARPFDDMAQLPALLGL